MFDQLTATPVCLPCQYILHLIKLTLLCTMVDYEFKSLLLSSFITLFSQMRSLGFPDPYERYRLIDCMRHSRSLALSLRCSEFGEI